MSTTTQTEYAEKVPASVWVARPRPMSGADGVNSISGRIESGRAFLKVVAYPWGVEFDVCDVEGEP